MTVVKNKNKIARCSTGTWSDGGKCMAIKIEVAGSNVRAQKVRVKVAQPVA